jgi:glycosyltransferase involved in cell wall biosynthesis
METLASPPLRHFSPIPAILRAAGVPPEISVVVPTYRRPWMLDRCLTALLAQEISPHRYEILVCDDGPDAETKRLVNQRASEYRAGGWHIVYVPVTRTQGPAGARNLGWKLARGDIIGFTDDDTIPDPRWLIEGLRAMQAGPSAVAGHIDVPLPLHPTDYELDAAGLGRAEFATANCFVRRSMLERIGGFDERYTSAWREDSDLQFSILCAGGTIARAESAVVHHPVRPARWGVSISQQKKSQFDALLYKKYPLLYGTRIAPSTPWRYYAIVLSLIVLAVASALRVAPVALAAFAVWATLTLVFTAQRLRTTARRPGHVFEMLVTSIVIPPLSIFWRLYGAWKFRVGFL